MILVARMFRLPLFGFVLSASAFGEVTWEQQAERLQLVNAASIDAAPIGEPITDSASVGFRSIISVLPKIDATVGAKTEKVPASPVHAVPTGVLEFAHPMGGGGMNFGGTLWAGYLPKGVEKLLGIKASLVQYLVGGSVLAEMGSGSLTYFSHIGFQFGNAKARGAITAVDATDSFDSTTTSVFLSPGIRHKASGLWGNVLLGYRNNKSTFLISESGTNLALQDKAASLVTQGTVGWQHCSGVQLALSEQFIPNRVLMPRVTLGYHYAFGGSKKVTDNIESVPMVPRAHTPTPQNKAPLQAKPQNIGNKTHPVTKSPVVNNKAPVPAVVPAPAVGSQPKKQVPEATNPKVKKAAKQ